MKQENRFYKIKQNGILNDAKLQYIKHNLNFANTSQLTNNNKYNGANLRRRDSLAVMLKQYTNSGFLRESGGTRQSNCNGW